MDSIKELTHGALTGQDAVEVLKDVREEITNLWLEKFSSDNIAPNAEYIDILSDNRTKLLILINAISNEIV
ncbi:MAG: hypothetical protein K5854_09625 [Prevotella sp.]|nr:hypothetical protein [Prevotella sp.]